MPLEDLLGPTRHHDGPQQVRNTPENPIIRKLSIFLSKIDIFGSNVYTFLYILPRPDPNAKAPGPVLEPSRGLSEGSWGYLGVSWPMLGPFGGPCRAKKRPT